MVGRHPLTHPLTPPDCRDRRKLTFYFKADKRIDFRDLTKENFRIFKSRIWMAMVPKDGECSLHAHAAVGADAQTRGTDVYELFAAKEPLHNVRDETHNTPRSVKARGGPHEDA